MLQQPHRRKKVDQKIGENKHSDKHVGHILSPFPTWLLSSTFVYISPYRINLRREKKKKKITINLLSCNPAHFYFVILWFKKMHLAILWFSLFSFYYYSVVQKITLNYSVVIKKFCFANLFDSRFFFVKIMIKL